MDNYQSTRPTLPPLHSLDLPTLRLRERIQLSGFNDTNEPYECSTLDHAHLQPRNRQPSTSSSATLTDISRWSSSSPSLPGLGVATGSGSKGNPVHAPRYQLVRSSLENADAILVVPPLTVFHIPPPSSSGTPAPSSKKGQGLLLVGSAMHQHLRHPHRNIAGGARIYPYRIVRVDALG